MGSKKRLSFEFNWSATQNVPYSPNIPLSGVTGGVMTGTNTIYSNVVNTANTDNEGVEITWTGTPTGTVQVLCSESGIFFYALTFNPALGQPAGAAGGYLINVNQIPFRYFMLQYTNVSGSGLLTAWLGSKDLN